MIGNTVAFLTSRDPDGRPNIMTVMPTDFVAFAPYLVGVTIKPSNFSHRCISEAGQFGLSIPAGSLAKELNYCGIVSGRDIDKFSAIDQEPVLADLCHRRLEVQTAVDRNAPYVVPAWREQGTLIEAETTRKPLCRGRTAPWVVGTG